MVVSKLLDDKLILAVDDEEDVLDIIMEELTESTDAKLHLATTFEIAQQFLKSHKYDLVILDIMGVKGFDLLKLAVDAGFPTVMLTAHVFTPEALKRSTQAGAKAYLPKEQLGALIPFLEEVLELCDSSFSKKALDRVDVYFKRKYGSDWRKSEQEFWEDCERGMKVENPAIIT